MKDKLMASWSQSVLYSGFHCTPQYCNVRELSSTKINVEGINAMFSTTYVQTKHVQVCKLDFI